MPVNRVSVLNLAIDIASLGDSVDPASAIYIDRDLARSDAVSSYSEFDGSRRPIKNTYYFDNEDFIVDLFAYLSGTVISFYGERFTKAGARASGHLQRIRTRDMNKAELRKNCESAVETHDAQGRPIAIIYYFPGRLVIADTFAYANTTDEEPVSATYGDLVPADKFLEVTLSTASAALNSPITVTYSYLAGFPAGTAVVPICTGLAGTFANNLLTPATGVVSISTTFTPTGNGYGQFTATNDKGLGNPAPKSLVVSSGGNFTYATGYRILPSLDNWVVGVPVTLTFEAVGGVFRPNTIITPTISGASGTFAPTTASVSGTSGTVVFTPTSAGTASLSAINNQSLTNPATRPFSVDLQALTWPTLVAGATASGNRITLPPNSRASGQTQALASNWQDVQIFFDTTQGVGERSDAIIEISDVAPGIFEQMTAFYSYNGYCGAIRLFALSYTLSALVAASPEPDGKYRTIYSSSPPVNNFISLKRDGTNILLRRSTDGVTWNTVATAANALNNASTYYLRIHRPNETNGTGQPSVAVSFAPIVI